MMRGKMIGDITGYFNQLYLIKVRVIGVEHIIKFLGYYRRRHFQYRILRLITPAVTQGLAF